MTLNRVMIIGNLGQDPEIRYTPSGLPVVNFSLATNESYFDKDGKRQQRVTWHRIVISGKLALVCHEHLKKGRQVFAEGRLRYAEWESSSEGRKQHRTEIVTAHVQFLGPPDAVSPGLGPDSPAGPTDMDMSIQPDRANKG